MKSFARALCQFRTEHPFQTPTDKQLIPYKLEEQYINSGYASYFIAVLFSDVHFHAASVINIKARSEQEAS